MRSQFLLIALLTAMVSWGQQFVTIGTSAAGNTNGGGKIDPVDGYYETFRFQAVYTKSELSNAGLSAGDILNGLGFSVSESPGTLVNYSIKMGHTNATDSGSHITTTGTVVKGPFSYTPTVVPDGSYDMIDFDNNFVWSGVDNIFIDICIYGNQLEIPKGGVRIHNKSKGSRFVTNDFGANECNGYTSSSNGFRPTIRFKYVGLGPCVAPPNGGTTELSPNSGSPGSTLNGTVNGASIGTGLTYQWQYSDNGSTWTNIAGQTSASLNTTAMPTMGTRQYRRAITCSGQTAYSTPATFTTTYCKPTYTYGCSSGATIVQVKTSEADENFSNSSSCDGSNGYSDYSANHNLSVKKEESFFLSVSIGTKSAGVKVWIDYNQDGLFDHSELVAATTSSLAVGSVWTSTIAIPSTALTGATRMRIRAVQNSTNFGPCDVESYGETEDYKVTILPGNPCKIPLVSTASNIGFTSAHLNWLATTSPNYEVEWSTTPSFAAAHSQTLNSIQHNISDLAPFTTYYYRVRSLCGGSLGNSNWSESESFKTGGFTPLEVSGFNQDVIANEGGGVNETTDAPVDAAVSTANHAFLERGYMGAIEGLPKNRVIGSSDELKYLFQDYTEKNSLRMNTNGSYSLTLNQQMPLSSLYVSGTSGNGTASINVEVVYTEGESQLFNHLSLSDWQSGDSFVTIVGSKIQREQSNPTPQIDSNNPKIHRLKLNGLDGNRLVKEIKFTVNNPNQTQRIANIFAISAQPEWARTTASTANSVCSGEETTFTFSGIDQTGFRIYDAPQGGNLIASTTDSNYSIALNQTGTYYVTAYRTEGEFTYENPTRKAVEVEWGHDNKFMASNGNWDTVTNWSANALPTIETCVKIPNGKKLTVNVEEAWAKNVTIENGGELVIEENQALIVQDFVENQASADQFIIKDGASLVQINNDAVNLGAVKVEKNFNFSADRQQYNFVSIPVEGFKLKAGTDPSQWLYQGMTYVLKYNEATDYFVNATQADQEVVGKGFAVKEASGNGQAGISGQFVGLPFNGLATYTLNQTTPEQGYNLLGNPYPSSLDLTAFYADNSESIGSTIWFWDNQGNTIYQQQGSSYAGTNYASYNVEAGGGTGVASPSGLVPTQFVRPGTGFLVQAKSHHAEVKFNNAQRSAQAAPAFVGKNGNLEVDRYWLAMETPGQLKVNMAVVYFDEGKNEYASDDSDAFGSSDELYSLIEAEQVIIQGKESFADIDVVPMGYRAFKRGTYKLYIYEQEGVFEAGQKIFLKDKQMNVTHDFSQGAYEFKSNAGEFNNRFEIVYKKGMKASGDVLQKNQIAVQKVNHEIEVTSTLDKIVEVEIYNLSGRSIMKARKINDHIWSVPAARYDKQILFVVVKTETGEIVTKKLVNK